MKEVLEFAKKYGLKYWRAVLLTVGILLAILALLWTIQTVDNWLDNRGIRKEQKAVNTLTNAAVKVNADIRAIEANANSANQEVKQARTAREVTKRNYDNVKKETVKAGANVNAVRNADYSGVSTVEANAARCRAYPASSECGRK